MVCNRHMNTHRHVLTASVLLCWFILTAGLPPPPELANCLGNGDRSQLTTYQNFVDGKPTRLTMQSGWWSAKQAPFNLSIVTGLTVSRLDQLEAQCKAWKGPLVAAVYLVLHVPPGSTSEAAEHTGQLEKAEQQMAALHKKLEASDGSCALDMMLLVETVSERVMRWMLPINVLRNYALLGARTKLVAMVDVDLLPSVGLSDWLAVQDNMHWLEDECRQKKVFVLPAFETAQQPNMEAAHKIAAAAASQDKKGMQKLVEAKQVWQFALKIFKEGHNCTEYQRWFASNQAYGPVGWTKDYEPWFIIDRTLTPFYDSVFRGYGWNKVTQVTNVHHQGFKFMVHPTGFLVHRQHSYSKAGSLYQASKSTYEKTLKMDKARAASDTSLAGTTHKFRNRVLEQLAKGTYSPTLDEGLKHCLATLTWWKHGSSAHSTPAPTPDEPKQRQQEQQQQQ